MEEESDYIDLPTSDDNWARGKSPANVNTFDDDRLQSSMYNQNNQVRRSTNYSIRSGQNLSSSEYSLGGEQR